jgi:hypothetical protein
MERNYNNEFERFLKENADQYRLYPSAKVWKGVYAALHGRRKWFGLGIALLLLTGTLITVLITNSPKQANIAVNTQPAATPNQTHNAKIFEINKSTPPARILNKQNNFGGDNSTAVAYDPNIILPGSVNKEGSYIASEKINIFQNSSLVNNTVFNPGNPIANNTGSLEPIDIHVTDELTDQTIFNSVSKTNPVPEQYSLAGLNTFNWTIESVLNTYRLQKRNKRVGFQLNVTPTISYRKLSENTTYMQSYSLQNSIPYSYVPLYNINNAVTHKPDMGLEVGLSAKYALASNFKIVTGLQFNINRYDIKAFYYPLETATIPLNYGSRVDSLHQSTTFRNFNGTKSRWLHNYYFQVSMPLGIEVKIAGDDKIQLGVGGTIQPTYVLGDRAYLLSTDYKNYAEVPWLIRRWNVNTAFETFVSYSTGHLKWQVGPQVRYQLLSSFVDKYPVKENLFDFGLKVGISLNNQ